MDSQTPLRARRFAGSTRLLPALAALALLSSAPSLAASAPAISREHVSFAMRGPLHTGAHERLVFQVHAAAGPAPTVLVGLTMPAMAMRERTLAARPLGRGRYAVRAPLTMPGRWLAHVTLSAGGSSVTNVLAFRTIDGHPTPWRTLAAGAGAFVLAVGLLSYRLRRRTPTPAARERPA